MAKRDRVQCNHRGCKKCVPKCKHAKPHYAETYHEGCDEKGPCWGNWEEVPLYTNVCCRPVKAAEGARDGR
jgi:hypothetical protein